MTLKIEKKKHKKKNIFLILLKNHMPFRNRKNRRKTYRKSKMPLSRAQVSAIKKISQVQTKKLAETKMKSKEVNDQLIGQDDQGYVISDISSLTQGTDNENREGDKAHGIGCQIGYTIQNTNTSVNYLARVVLIESDEGEYNDATDNWLLSTANEPLALSAGDPQDCLRSLNRKDFKGRVLYDRLHKLYVQETANRSGGGCMQFVKSKFFKFNHSRTFANDSSTSSTKHNLRCLVIVRAIDGSTPTAGQDVNFHFNSRYYFKDF